MDEVEKTVDKVDEGKETAKQEDKKIDYMALYNAASKSIAELTAERDSLKNENDQLRTARDQAITDGQKAREMNYTLSRQLDISAKQAHQPEEILAEMFLKKGE